MKRLLTLLIIFVLIIFNTTYTSASYMNENYGNYLIFTTLSLHDDFEFTGYYWFEEETNNYIFEFKPVENSMDEFIRFLWSNVYNFMDIYHSTYGTSYKFYPYPYSDTIEPIAWSVDDGYIYLIIKTTWFQELEINEQDILPTLDDLTKAINVDTFVFSELTDDYSIGYNKGYNKGYKDAFKDTTTKIISSVFILIGPILVINMVLRMFKTFKLKH